MKIDLKSYAGELAFWVDAFKQFVDRGSHSALSQLKRELEDGRDNQRPEFVWKLGKPIMTVEADKYDGPDRTPHKVRIGWQFHAKFRHDDQAKRGTLWTVKEMATHIYVYSADDNQQILHFHHDMKNEGQLGPHVHMQLSEAYQKGKGPIAIAVPRFPSTAVLPTDCLDFVLSEFFPFTWPKSQSGSRGLKTLQNKQRARLLAMAREASKGWEGSRMTPIAAIQECYAPDMQIA